MPRRDKQIRLEILDSLFQTQWSSYDEISKKIKNQLNIDPPTKKSIQNYIKSIKEGKCWPQDLLNEFEMNSDGYYDVIEERQISKEKEFKYIDPNFTIFPNKLSENISNSLVPFIEFVRQVSGIENVFGTVIDGIEELLEAQGINIHGKTTPNNLQLDVKELFNVESGTLVEIYIPKIIQAIANKLPLRVYYKPFKFAADVCLKIHPYKLVEFNKRWFLIAYLEEVFSENIDNPYFNRLNLINNFAVDRISSIDKQYPHDEYHNAKVDINQVLQDTIGISVDFDNFEKENVKIELSDSLVPYFLSKPIHFKQKNKGNLFEYNIIITRELEQILLSYGENIKVISPETLRARMSDRIKKMNKIYY